MQVCIFITHRHIQISDIETGIVRVGKVSKEVMVSNLKAQENHHHINKNKICLWKTLVWLEGWTTDSADLSIHLFLHSLWKKIPGTDIDETLRYALL